MGLTADPLAPRPHPAEENAEIGAQPIGEQHDMKKRDDAKNIDLQNGNPP
jgi:hypothetical protein